MHRQCPALHDISHSEAACKVCGGCCLVMVKLPTRWFSPCCIELRRATGTGVHCSRVREAGTIALKARSGPSKSTLYAAGPAPCQLLPALSPAA